MTKAEHIKGVVGCGAFLALTASAFGADAPLQWAMFAFGVTYGHLWLSHS